MRLFRRKISYEEYWLGLIDSFFVEAEATQEVFIIIFPEFNPVLGNSKSLMEDNNITREDLLAFKLLCVLVSLCVNLRVYEPDNVSRFERFLNGEKAIGAKKVFSGYGLELNDVSEILVAHFGGQDIEPFSVEDSRSATWLEPIPASRQDIKLRILQTSVGASYLQKICQSRLPNIAKLLSVTPLDSRDKLMNVVAMVQRLDNHMKGSFKPV